MKKILAFFSTFILIFTTTITVIACAPKTESDVLFIIPGNVINSDKKKPAKAYDLIVKEFNESEEMKNSKVKVKVKWEADNPINLRIQSNQQLPDLYLSYADNVANYVTSPLTKDKVRNMETSAINDETTHEEFKQQFWSPTLYDEGYIDGNLYVLPLNKSYDISILNVKVFLELVSYVDELWARIIGAHLSEEGYTIQQTKLFDRKKLVTLEIGDELKSNIKKIVDAEPNQTSDEVRNFFQKDSNVLGLVSIYNQLYNQALDEKSLKDNYIGSFGDTGWVYPIGIETPSNKIFMEYADQLNKGNIDPMDHVDAKDFFYEVQDLNPKNQSAKIVFDNVNNPSFQNVNNFFETLRQLAPKSAGNNNDYRKRWSGAFIPGKLANSKTVNGTYFVQGTMLLTSATSAGSYDYNPDINVARQPQFDKNTDLMVLPTSTSAGNYANFFQQGAGLAGFKSVGSNKADKEIVVNKFLNYLLKPTIQNRLSIMAGYLPSTVGALEMYRYYKNDDYDNATGNWKDGVKKPSYWEQFEQVPNLTTDSKNGAPINEADPIIIDFINHYLLFDNPKIKTNIVTTSGNPFGTIIRDALVTALRNYIFTDPQKRKFTELLDDNDELWNIKRQILKPPPGNYNKLEVTFRK